MKRATMALSTVLVLQIGCSNSGTTDEPTVGGNPCRVTNPGGYIDHSCKTKLVVNGEKRGNTTWRVRANPGAGGSVVTNVATPDDSGDNFGEIEIGMDSEREEVRLRSGKQGEACISLPPPDVIDEVVITTRPSTTVAPKSRNVYCPGLTQFLQDVQQSGLELSQAHCSDTAGYPPKPDAETGCFYCQNLEDELDADSAYTPFSRKLNTNYESRAQAYVLHSQLKELDQSYGSTQKMGAVAIGLLVATAVITTILETQRCEWLPPEEGGGYGCSF